MAQQKKRTLHGSIWQEQLVDLERRMRAYTGPSPSDSWGSVCLLFLCRYAPGLLLESSVEAERLRFWLATLITKFPAYTIAGLSFLHQEPKADPDPPSPSAAVREFLLTHDFLDLPGGKRVPVAGATDEQIASAAEAHYKQHHKETPERRLDKINKKIAQRERERLEHVHGGLIADLSELVFKAAGGIDQLCPKDGDLAKHREEIRDWFHKGVIADKVPES